MRLLVDGRRLEVVDHRTAVVRHLIDLRVVTRRWHPSGLGMRALEDLYRVKAGIRPGREGDPAPELWAPSVAYLTRRAAGDDVSFREVAEARALQLVRDEDDVPDAAPEQLPEGPTTTGARFPGDTRTRRRPRGTSGADWPFDDVAQSLGEHMAAVSHHWPGINPLTVYQLPIGWWAYYVRQAQQINTGSPS